MSIFGFLGKKNDKTSSIAPPPPPSAPRVTPAPPPVTKPTIAPPKPATSLQNTFSEPLPTPKAVGIPNEQHSLPSLPPLFKLNEGGQAPQPAPVRSPIAPVVMPSKPAMPVQPVVRPVMQPPVLAKPAPVSVPLSQAPPLPKFDAKPAALPPLPKLPPLSAMPKISVPPTPTLSAPEPLKAPPKLVLPSLPVASAFKEPQPEVVTAKSVATPKVESESKLAKMLEELSLDDFNLDDLSMQAPKMSSRQQTPAHREQDFQGTPKGPLFLGVADFEQALIQMKSTDEKLHSMQANNERLGAVETHTKEALDKLNEAFEHIQKHLLIMDEKLFKVS